MAIFHYKKAFTLESGEQLPGLTIAYTTYGHYDAAKNNVVWICHALTANANAADWWPGVVGEHDVLNPGDYFIVCANILGSCYGTTGPLSINESTGEPYYHTFPFITIRDIARAHQLLREHLGITKIKLLAGGSMGGYQVLEWSIMEPGVIENLFLIATSAHESPWGIAIHTAQRLAIEADTSWRDPVDHAGQNGLKAARAFGMITYRSYANYAARQSEDDVDKTDHFKASSYIQYQGQKLVSRFNAYSYWLLTKALDSHNIARGRQATIEQMLQKIQQPTLIIGITTDLLCPLQELRLLATNMPQATYIEIDSLFGHDGFLVEATIISKHIKDWMNHQERI